MGFFRKLGLAGRRGFRLSGLEILDLLIEAAYLGAVFLVPLWFASFFPTYNIFEFNKLCVFRISFWLLFLLTVIKIAFYGSRFSFSFKAFFRKYWLWPLVFVAGLSLSLLSSIDAVRSFYGTIERQAGLVSYLYYFFWFILVSFNILTVSNHLPDATDSKERKLWRIVMAMVVSATLVSVYGLLQILGLDRAHQGAGFFFDRISSSLGQPNFLASWLLLVIPVGVYAALKSRRFLAKAFLYLAVAIQAICLFLTGSRGGLLAFFFAAALCAAYLLARSSWTRRRKLIAGLGVAILAVIALGSVELIWPGRVKGMFDIGSGSVGVRANLYSSAADAIRQRPLSGYGLESGEDVFIQYYEPDWATYGEVGQSADRAHNLVLDTMLNAGFYGLALFAVLYYFFFSLAQDNIRKGKMAALSLSLALGAAAYLFSLLFSFSIVSGELYFWLFLAMLTAINYDGDETAGQRGWFVRLWEGLLGLFRKMKLGMILAIVGVVAAAALSFWQIVSVFRSLAADYYFNKIYFTLPKPDYFTALTLDGYLKEQKVNPSDQASYDRFWGDKLSEFYPSISELAAREATAEKLQEVVRNLPDTGYRNLLSKAKAYNALGHYAFAEIYLDRVIAQAPHWPLVYMELAKLKTNENDTEKALAAYDTVLKNLPSVSDERLNDEHRDLLRRYYYFIYYRMGEICERTGKYAAASGYYHLAYGSDPSDYVLLKRIADMAYLQGNLKEAIEHTQHGLARNPGDYKWHVALASLYYEIGDKKTAMEYLKKAWELQPGNQEIADLQKVYGK